MITERTSARTELKGSVSRSQVSGARSLPALEFFCSPESVPRAAEISVSFVFMSRAESAMNPRDSGGIGLMSPGSIGAVVSRLQVCVPGGLSLLAHKVAGSLSVEGAVEMAMEIAPNPASPRV